VAPNSAVLSARGIAEGLRIFPDAGETSASTVIDNNIVKDLTRKVCGILFLPRKSTTDKRS
jgi:hypothetical protein